MEQQKTLHNVLKDSFVYIPSHFIPALCGLVSITLFTRLLSMNDFSKYVLVMTTVTFAANICFAWLNYSGFRFFDEYKSNIGPFLSTSLISLFLLIIAISLLGIVFAAYYKIYSPSLGIHLPILVCIPLLASKTLFEQLLLYMRADRKVVKYSLLKSIDAITKLGLGVLFVYLLSSTYTGVIYGMIVSYLGLAFYEMVTSQAYKTIKLNLFSKEVFLKLFHYGLPLVGAGITGTALSLSDRYLIAYFCEYNRVGLYGAGYRLAEMLIDAPASILLLAYTPIIIKAFNTDGEIGIGEKLSQSFRLIFIILIPATIGSIMLSKELVNVFLDEQYQDVFRIFVWVCTGTFFVSVNHLYTRVFELKNVTKLVFVISGIAAIGNLLLNVLLIPIYGYVGAAIATLAAYFLQCMISYRLSDRLIHVPIPYKTLFNALIGSIAMCLCIIALQKVLAWSHLLNLLINISAGFVSYVMTIFLLRDPTIISIIEIFSKKQKPDALI